MIAPDNPWNSGGAPLSPREKGDTSRQLDDQETEVAPDPLEASESGGFPAAPKASGVLDCCPSCMEELDVTGIAPFSVVACPACRQEFRVLERIAGFALSEQIGSGPSGVVYSAVKPPSESAARHWKIFRQEIASIPEYASRIADAGRSLSTFSHPNIVRVHSAGSQNGLLYAAMERVSGASLAEAIAKRGRLPEGEVLALAAQVAEALQAACNFGLDHGDLKPSNILFAGEGNVKVSDFGHAPVGAETEAIPAEAAQIPYYSSPERLSGGSEDTRSDFYSLGAVLFQCLTGRPPFPGQTAQLVIQKHLGHGAPGVQAFVPEISTGTASVVAKMLEKVPSKRHQDCQELLDHLRFARSEFGRKSVDPNAAMPGQADAQAKARRTHLYLAGAGAALALAILGGGAIWLRGRHAAPTDGAVAPGAAPGDRAIQAAGTGAAAQGSASASAGSNLNGVPIASGLAINFDAPGASSGAVNYFGQGAYADPGNNYWNAIVANGTTPPAKFADGSTPSPITLTCSSDSLYSVKQHGVAGTPSALELPFFISKHKQPKTCTLNDVPPGIYTLYLCGINGAGLRKRLRSRSTTFYDCGCFGEHREHQRRVQSVHRRKQLRRVFQYRGRRQRQLHRLYLSTKYQCHVQKRGQRRGRLQWLCSSFRPRLSRSPIEGVSWTLS